VDQDFEPMQLFKWIATGLLVLPVAELAAFILVASQVGFVTALGLLILISLGGVLVLRHAGGAAVTRLRTAAGASEIRGIALDGSGTSTALGGILMLIPGFITGVLGLLMLVPATRSWLTEMTVRHFTQRPRTPPPGTIDLTPDEWRQLPDPELPPRRSRRKPEDRHPG
jgi:UPF0716 protein FxsA